ncbi:MAG: transglutaminase domain-containing protein [Clostridia bacterium]|nr:transglutaminase domain-containing protein [Clostridia bacterium]
MKRVLTALTMLALTIALAAGIPGGAESRLSFETPAATAGSCLAVYGNALSSFPGVSQRGGAIPEALEELLGFLDGKCAAANDIREALAAMEEDGDASARRAGTLLLQAAGSLREEDVATPFGPEDLAIAAKRHLLPVADVAAFAEAFDAAAREQMDTFFILCGDELLDEVHRNASVGDAPLLADIAVNCGVIDFREYRVEELSMSVFDAPNYYAGQRILRAWRMGDTSALSDAERQTLQAALAVAEGAEGSALERERYIHDALCGIIAYSAEDDPLGRKDCAVGALLDGRADCDGYSDAFSLCCGLAGLETRFIHGFSTEAPEEDVPQETGEDGSHLWNLVNIDGHWVSVDVTWDDQDPGILYCNYNLGSDAIGLSHAWDGRALTVALETDTSNALRDGDLALHATDSWDGLYALFREKAAERPKRIALLIPEASGGAVNEERVKALLYSTGVTACGWYAQNGIVELTDLEYRKRFAICETAEEVSAWIEACAEAGAGEFAIYFTPELGRALFANDHAGLVALLSASRLYNVSYGYDEESRMVVVSEAAYGEAVVVPAGLDDVRAGLSEALEARSASAQFLLPDGTEFEAVAEELSPFVYAHGVESFVWRASGRRVILDEVTYYPEFARVADEAALRAYLDRCREAGIADFRAYCPEDCYRRLCEDGGAGFFELLDESGCSVSQFFRDDTCGALIVEGAQWK